MGEDRTSTPGEADDEPCAARMSAAREQERAPWQQPWAPGKRLAIKPWRGVQVPKAARFPKVKALPQTPIATLRRRQEKTEGTDG